ncbi:hypothetical protein B0T24DRAFT_4616 [Lasiosphaeria ovina]|uniref:Uncharacterized protein n=1 Tax=Lasiosphaeria ovina TaxID=92902 RepID=A0AAE0NIR3_9PEZI|nr:hypothetical protein B0T24DRAFT_4616 [Lasiosphaeria ovina]
MGPNPPITMVRSQVAGPPPPAELAAMNDADEFLNSFFPQHRAGVVFRAEGNNAGDPGRSHAPAGAGASVASAFPRYPAAHNPVRSMVEPRIARLAPGPMPEAGTPQERFRMSVLGGVPSGTGGVAVHGGGRLAYPQTRFNGHPVLSAAGHFTPGAGGPPQQQRVVPQQQRVVPQPVRREPQPPSEAQHREPKPSSEARRPEQRGIPKAGNVMLLSLECQRRSFNPEWFEMTTPQGYICNVKLRDVTVEGDKARSCPTAAKGAVAAKALAIISEWPVPDRGHAGPAGAPVGAPGVKIKQEIPRAQPAIPGHANTAARGADQEHARLLDQIQNTVGISVPPHSRANAEVARAFLEGFDAGARLARQAGMRSRSPPGHRARSPRGRSPRGRSPVQRRDRSPYRHFYSDHYKPKGPVRRDDAGKPSKPAAGI